MFLKWLKTPKNEFKQLGIDQERVRWIHHLSNYDDGGEFYGHGAGERRERCSQVKVLDGLLFERAMTLIFEQMQH